MKDILTLCMEEVPHTDDDLVKCRWAVYGEADFASTHDSFAYESLILDEISCILSYNIKAPLLQDWVGNYNEAK